MRLLILDQSRSLKLSHSVTIISASAPIGQHIRIGTITDGSKHLARLRHRLRIVGADLRLFLQQPSDQLYRGREANVVGIGLEGQAEDANAFVLQSGQSDCVAVARNRSMRRWLISSASFSSET